MTFRDWRSTLRPASYRGVPFFVESDSLDGGRRLVVHEFVLAERWYTEDIGSETQKAHVTAYVVGDASDGQAAALVAACNRKGAGSLSLPLGRRSAQCDKCKRDFKKDKLGYIAFDISFVLEPATSISAFPAAYLGELVRLAVGALPAAITGRLSALVTTIGQASFVQDAAVAIVRDVAATIDGTLRTIALDPGLAPGLFRQVQALYDDAPALAIIGSRGHDLSLTTFAAAATGATPTPLIERLSSLVSAIGEAAAPVDVEIAIAPLLAYAAEAAPAALTASARQDAQNSAALAEAVRALAVGALAASAVSRAYPDRRSAIAMRAVVSEAIGGELATLAGPSAHGLYTALADLQGRTVAYLSRKSVDLAPIVTVTADRQMPSLWWSQRLYGDAGHAADLRVRNGVIHPGFMPLEFEALTR